MLLGFHSTVQEKIVLSLSREGALPAAALLRSALLQKITKQALYQELRSLMREGVVIKVNKLYSLRFAWVLAFQELSGRMYRSSVQGSAARWIPESGKLSWILPDVPRALSLWSHISMALFKHEPQKQLLEWAPHAWYHLISTEVEAQFQKTLQREKVDFFLIVGDDTYLDHSYEPYFKLAGRQISFAPGPFARLQREYFSVIGEYLIRLIFPETQAQAIHRLYRSAAGRRAVDIGALNRILAAKCRIKLEVARNPQRTAQLRKLFREYFGKL